jgi:hypothetical protein
MADQPDHELAKRGSVAAAAPPRALVQRGRPAGPPAADRKLDVAAGVARETAADDHRRSVADRSCMGAALAAVLGSVVVASVAAFDPEESPVG